MFIISRDAFILAATLKITRQYGKSNSAQASSALPLTWRHATDSLADVPYAIPGLRVISIVTAYAHGL